MPNFTRSLYIVNKHVAKYIITAKFVHIILKMKKIDNFHRKHTTNPWILININIILCQQIFVYRYTVILFRISFIL